MGNLILNKKKLDKLEMYNANNFTNLTAVYVFRSANINLLATIIDPVLFTIFDATIDFFSDPLTLIQSFSVFTGNTWVYSPGGQNANNYVIPKDSIFILTNVPSNLIIPVGGGAIIENYYQGKISIKKQNLGGGKLNLN